MVAIACLVRCRGCIAHGNAILSAQTDAIIAADKEGVIIFWNPGTERIRKG